MKKGLSMIIKYKPSDFIGDYPRVMETHFFYYQFSQFLLKISDTNVTNIKSDEEIIE